MNGQDYSDLLRHGTISNKYQRFPNIVGILPGDRVGLGYFPGLQTRKQGFSV